MRVTPAPVWNYLFPDSPQFFGLLIINRSSTTATTSHILDLFIPGRSDLVSCGLPIFDLPVLIPMICNSLTISYLILSDFIHAGNEPSGHAGMSIWQLPRGSNTPMLASLLA